MARRNGLWLLVFGLAGLLCSALWAADPPSAAGPLLGLLKKGTLPANRVPSVAKMVCERGNDHDLAYVFSEAAGDKWPVELRRDALQWLQEAARTRKVNPAGDVSALAELIAKSPDRDLRRRAIELAGLWKTPAAVEPLRQLANDAQADPALRAAAIDALVQFGGDVAEQTVQRLLGKNQPLPVRIKGVAALAGRDLDRAAQAAVEVLQAAGAQDDPGPVIDAFLNSRGGADKLAAALEKSPPSVEVALLALRHMYAVGRSDPALDRVLSERAGINAEAPKLSEEEIRALADEAVKSGDAERGEAVFRRADLACLRCHAVSKGGGQIGPDLSPVGASSPVDYLVKSIFDPDAQKKEEFVTRILLTNDGQQFTGIAVNRTEDKIVLKTADGKRIEVPTADLDYEGEGKSLMPEGLVKFMTRQEVLDLVKFLSMLGKPNTPYAIRQTQRMQRWRALLQAPEAILRTAPNDELFGDVVLRAGVWESVYARVNGDLPLDDVVKRTGQPVVYVQGEVDVTEAGRIGIRLNDAAGVALWVDEDSYPLTPDLEVDFAPGRHAITLRIDTTVRMMRNLQLELLRLPGSAAQFTVVDGA